MKAKEIYPEKQLMHFVNAEILKLNNKVQRYLNHEIYTKTDIFSEKINIYFFDRFGDIVAVSRDEKEGFLHTMFDEQIEPFAIAHVTKTPNGYQFERITYNQFYQQK